MVSLRKSMRTSASPQRGICLAWRVIGAYDTTFPFPKQAGILGNADLEIVRGGVRSVFAFVRRQDGGSPCGGRGATALPSVAASCDPPAGRDKRDRSRCGGHDMMLFHAG